MQRENYNRLFALLIVLGMTLVPALGFSVSYSSGDGSGSVSSSASYSLDDSSSLQQQAVLSGSQLMQTSQASGSGNNTIESSVGGSGYSVNNKVDSSGSMAVSTTTAAAAGAAGISQSADLSGKSGGVSMISSSQNNKMAVASDFSGDTNMKSDLSAVAADRAAMSGSQSIAGVPVLNDDHLQTIASGDIGMSVDGLYLQDSGKIGKFSVASANLEDAPGSGTPFYTVTGPGSSSSYVIAGWRWNSISASNKINMYVRNDANLQAEGLTGNSVANAVYKATQTWNAATAQKPFSAAPVGYGTAHATDTKDGYNVVAFKYLSDAPSALAYSRTWYAYPKVTVGGRAYYSAVESDLSLNTRYSWGTGMAEGSYYNGRADVQTTVLHELGHTLGLGDLYNLPSTDSRRSDTNQVMNLYNDVQTTLGAGDKNAIGTLYGRPA